MVVALDTAKALDSVEWTYFGTCLERFGIGPRFIKWVWLLYQDPVARVVANGWSSEQFPLTRGTRQGCPLTPLLYALAAEPLSMSLRSNPDIVGLCVGSIMGTVCIYADDTLLYVDGSTDAPQKALAEIELFGSFSGLKINWDKSQILPLDSFPEMQEQARLPLQRVNCIKYLGIHITRPSLDYIRLNVQPLFDILKHKTQIWAILPLGVMGRINLVKMVLLPKILYVLWHSPVYLVHNNKLP